MENIPKEVQDKLAQFQGIQQQLQLSSMQRQQIMAGQKGIEDALGELGHLKEGKVFKVAGPLIIESSKEASTKELGEAKDANEARLKVLEKQEKKLAEKYESLQHELQHMLGGQGGHEQEGEKPPKAG